MDQVARQAWANPSSLHGPGLVAAEQLERSRLRVGDLLGCDPETVVFTSGGTESIHLALLGTARWLEKASPGPSRMVISAVEHPATLAATQELERRGWQLAQVPVDRQGCLDLKALAALLEPPTRLVSLIWGQSEVGSIQPIAAAGALCRQAGVVLHVDAVQVVGHQALSFRQLPVDLLSCTAHKLQGPRGIGVLLVRQGLALEPLFGGGGQERGRRAGTEPVALAAGLAAAFELADQRLRRAGGTDPLEPQRNGLLTALLHLPGVELTGPIPDQGRLPHHISLLLRSPSGAPLSGRMVVRALAREGIACSSGSACSSQGQAGSPVLRAMGYGPDEALGGLRLSLGPWHLDGDPNALLERVPAALQRAMAQLSAAPPTGEPQ
jgi:cysteine desulfurase